MTGPDAQWIAFHAKAIADMTERYAEIYGPHSAESGIMPKPHEVMENHDGLIRWRPEFDTLRVERLAFGERRIVVRGAAGHETAFKLSADQVEHVIGLLRG